MNRFTNEALKARTDTDMLSQQFSGFQQQLQDQQSTLSTLSTLNSVSSKLSTDVQSFKQQIETYSSLMQLNLQQQQDLRTQFQELQGRFNQTRSDTNKYQQGTDLKLKKIEFYYTKTEDVIDSITQLTQ